MQFVDFQCPNNFDLVLGGDTHEGTMFRDAVGVQKMIDYVLADKDRYFIFMGDAIEAIAVDDHRYDPLTHTGATPVAQATAVVSQFKPLAEQGRIITWLVGNHEYKLRQFGDIVRYHICEPLGINYGTYTAIVSFVSKNGGVMFKGFFFHGSRSLSATSDDPSDAQYALQRKLKRQLKDKMGDCALMAVGHNHKLVIREPSVTLTLVSDGKRCHDHYITPEDYSRSTVIHPDYRWYVSTGSFLKLYQPGYSNYAEIAGYDPIDLGFIVVEVRDGFIRNIRKELV